MFLSAYFGQSTLQLIALRFLPGSHKKIFKTIFYFAFLINAVHCDGQSPNKREPETFPDLSKELKLVENEGRQISGNSNGFEVFVSRFNETADATIFNSIHLPDHILHHGGSDDTGKESVILPNDPEMKVAYPNVTTFILLKAIVGNKTRYSSHLAYVRNFGQKTSVEWDVYSFHFHNNNDSFVQAFIPIREGPSTITIGLGYTLTRSRREEKETRKFIRESKRNNPTLAPDLSTMVKKGRRGTSPTNSLKTLSELMDPSKGEMKDESNVDHGRPKKSDSDLEDLQKLDFPYVGIGDCDFLQNKFNSPLPTDKIKLVAFFLQVLKAQCSPTIMKKTLQLFDDNLVTFGDPADITVNRKKPLFKKKILGEMEWVDLASAILLSEFSKVFGEQHRKFILRQTDNRAPDGKRISGTVKTLTIVTTRILDSLQSTENHHAIKFVNLLLVILQAQRSELVTGGDELIKCNKCNEEKEVNFNDQVQLYVLMKFIATKLPEIMTASSKTEEMFTSFYISNVNTISPFVKDKIPFMYSDQN